MTLRAQSVITNASSSCACDGIIEFTASAPGDIIITGAAGEFIGDTNNSDYIFVNNICPGVYVIQTIINGEVDNIAVNVASANFNPGQASTQGICNTTGPTSLNNFITGQAAGGTWTDPNGSVHSATFNPAVDVEGLYVYHVTNGGCEVNTGVYVELIANADPGDYVNYLICEDYEPFDMTDWMGDPNGVWFDSNGDPVSSWFDPAVQNTSTFVYMIDTVVGCPPVYASMTVTENLLPDPGEDATVLVCSNGTNFDMTDYLGGTPQLNGQWFNPFNTPVADIFNPNTMPEGQYRYRVSGTVPCPSQNAFLTIEFTDTNPSGTSGTVALCSNGTSINMLDYLNGSPLAGGTWTNAADQTVDGNFAPASEQAGVYTYYYPNVGCSPGDANLTITVETLPNAGNNNTTTLCETTTSINLNTLLSAGATAGGVWTNSSNTVVAALQNTSTMGASASYTYSVNGVVCPDDAAQITITIDETNPAPGNTFLTLCSAQEPVNLQDLYTIDPLIFENAQGQTITSLFDPSSNGSQTITVIQPSSNACPDGVSAIAITVESPAFISDTLSVNLCTSEEVYDLEMSNDAIDFTAGSWTNDNGALANTLISLTGNQISEYQFTGSSQSICEASVWTVVLSTFTPYEAGENANVVFCSTDDITAMSALLPVASGGLGSWTFNESVWNDPNFDPSVDAAGVYTYTLPANGPCPADEASVDIFIQNGIAYSAGPDIAQCSPAVGLQIGQDVLNGVSYEWTPGQNLSSTTAATPTLNLTNSQSVPVTWEYQVEVSDGVCVEKDTVMITLYPLPVSQLADNYELCEEEEITLDPNTTSTISWSPASLFADPNAPSQTWVVSSTEDIHVILENNWGCSIEQDVHVEVHPLPTAVYTLEETIVCPPLLWQMSLDASSTYCDEVVWTIDEIGNFEGSAISVPVNQSGIYTGSLQVTSNFGCTQAYELGTLFELLPRPQAGFAWEPNYVSTIEPIAQLIDLSVDAETYEWNIGGFMTSSEAEPLVEFPADSPGNYEICQLVTNEFGCQDSTCDFIDIDNEYIFFAPNTFTPDGDGLNEYFKPVILGFDETTYTLQIFDRWGTIVFETNDTEKPCIGNVRGGEHFAEAGVYVWRVEVKDKENAEYRIFKGHITLLR